MPKRKVDNQNEKAALGQTLAKRRRFEAPPSLDVNKNRIEALPSEILLHILSFLPAESLTRCERYTANPTTAAPPVTANTVSQVIQAHGPLGY